MPAKVSGAIDQAHARSTWSTHSASHRKMLSNFVQCGRYVPALWYCQQVQWYLEE